MAAIHSSVTIWIAPAQSSPTFDSRANALSQVGNAAVPKAKINDEAAAPKPTERFWTEGRERAAERLAHEKSGQESGGLPITSGVLSAPEWDLFRQNPVVGALVLLHAKTAVTPPVSGIEHPDERRKADSQLSVAARALA
ncbi:hypothetical protein ACE102_37635 [Bradyrhizobium sp. vgs-9]|uniref:hypothetical protein n=1 Tax=Bradyrhizobium sp. vgs-9 TaxID=208389 RepID=UPI0035D48FE4